MNLEIIFVLLDYDSQTPKYCIVTTFYRGLFPFFENNVIMAP
jgi:hypothetical protein